MPANALWNTALAIASVLPFFFLLLPSNCESINHSSQIPCSRLFESDTDPRIQKITSATSEPPILPRIAIRQVYFGPSRLDFRRDGGYGGNLDIGRRCKQNKKNID